MKIKNKYNVSVLGAGSWGTALAQVLAENEHAVTLWEFRPDAADHLNKTRVNSEFLPDIPIPASIRITSDLEKACDEQDIIVVAVPSHVVRSVSEQVNEIGKSRDAVFVNVAKGVENETLLRMSQVLKETINWVDNKQIVTLSGPSHAEEVSRRIPTAIVAAGHDLQAAEIIQHAFMNMFFRVYTNEDIIGVQLGGALKNVIAIAAGICDGAGFGDNTKAALQPRGLAEMARLGVALGSKAITFAGLSGMGDLIVTCMSKHSRNRHVGEQVGRGRKLEDILNEMVMVAEGVKTTRSAYALSQKYAIEMPITEQVYQMLFENKNAKQALNELMQRDPKREKLG